jgi:hypothetical protein
VGGKTLSFVAPTETSKTKSNNGNLNINLGYDFIPGVQNGNLFKVGLASLIRF